VAAANADGLWVMVGPPDGPVLPPDEITVPSQPLRSYVLVSWDKLVPPAEAEALYRTPSHDVSFIYGGQNVPRGAWSVPDFLAGPPPRTPLAVIVTIEPSGVRVQNTIELE
jgi:hypothetical protein